MKHYIDKSALVAEIEKRLDELYNLLPDASKVENGSITISEACNTGKYTELESFRRFINDLEVKDADLEKEKVENIKKQCPFREVVCSKYQNHPLKCSGACAFVSDRNNFRKKHLYDIQNVPVDEERLKIDRRNTV